MPKYKEVKPGKVRTGKGYELLLWSDGGKSWTYNGKLHREDGHAIEGNNRKEWYLYGKQLEKDWFLKNQEQINKMKAWELFEPVELVRLKHDI